MKKIFLFLFIVSVILSACEEYMDISIDGEKQKYLVVEGSFTTDTTAHEITLSRSGDFFNKLPRQPETGADVSITDGVRIYPLNETIPGVYLTDPDVYGETGKTYTLNIRLADSTEYSATEIIHALPEIDSISVRDTLNPFLDGLIVFYFGKESPGHGDYYMWSLRVNNELYTDSLFENTFSDDEMVDGQYISDFPLFYIPNTRIEKDTVDVELLMYSISQSYYDYLTGLLLETVWKGSPWDAPPANAHGNISNGALGYFRASGVKTARKRIIRSEIHKR